MEEIQTERDVYFLCVVRCLFSISLLDKVFSGCFRQAFFHLGDQKKCSLIAFNRWSSYTVTIVREFAGADSALVVLDEWSSYRGGRLNKFDCNVFKLIQNNFICLMEKYVRRYSRFTFVVNIIGNLPKVPTAILLGGVGLLFYQHMYVWQLEEPFCNEYQPVQTLVWYKQKK